MKIPNVLRMYWRGEITEGELYGTLLRLASDEPVRLKACRAALSTKPVLAAGFDYWLCSALKPDVKFIVGEGPSWTISEGLKAEIRKILLGPNTSK